MYGHLWVIILSFFLLNTNKKYVLYPHHNLKYGEKESKYKVLGTVVQKWESKEETPPRRKSGTYISTSLSFVLLTM